MKIVIVVDGGVVQDVYSDNPNVKVKLVDLDDLRETLTRKEREMAVDAAVDGLDAVIIG